MRPAILVCVVAFLAPVAHPADALTVGSLRAVCSMDKIRTDGSCSAFFRGVMERFVAVPLSPGSPSVACRSTPLAEEDLSSLFNRYASSADATPLTVPRIVKNPPCLDAPGTWTNARLRQACREDASGSCRFYIAGVLLEAGLEMRLHGQRFFCYRPDAPFVTSEFNLLIEPSSVLANAVLRWMDDHPSQADDLAAKGALDAFAAAFPCREEEKRIVYPDTF